MANQKVSLTTSMRNNLLSLQNTQKMMDTTQNRLATGKKVNSAMDNPSSYFTAQSLSTRADDLNTLMDSMGQAVQSLTAIDHTIGSLTTFAQQLKSIVNSAQDTGAGDERTTYMNQFNDVIDQMDEMVNNSDGGYKGINLSKSTESLTVKFNEQSGGALSKLVIQGVDLSSASGLGIDKLSNPTSTEDWNDSSNGTTNMQDSLDQVETAIKSLRTTASNFAQNLAIVQNRQDFTKNMINTLTAGADALTLADMNEEAANMLALQVRQQLGTNSLSMAAQSQQSVLSLF
ncbi:hypothetical protein FACS1894186_4710 [Alphaproteobacteria bacterium]|nr:hypothetical protein FACS1894186_4710 [Alphaproteobacteria bacterium]